MSIAPSRFVRTALFPVAGLGTRFLPATKAMPTEMLPIVDKPLIQYAVEEAVAAGIEHVVLITHQTKRAIEDHFDASLELEKLLELQGKHALLYELRGSFPTSFSLSCVRQNQAAGLGHALLCARHLVGHEAFAVVLPNDLMQAARPVLAQMIQQYRRCGGSILAMEQPGREGVTQYGAIDGHSAGERIRRLAAVAESEQAPSFRGLVGRYIFSPGIFDALDECAPGPGQELELADGLKKLLSREPVFAYWFEGRRFDCGTKLGFLEATVEFALEHPEVGEASANVLGRVHGVRAARPNGATAVDARVTPVLPS